jgi:predicted membrane-bound spermidine synthase
MRVRVNYSTSDIQIDEIFDGTNADAIVSAMQRLVAARAGFAIRLLVNSLSPLQFAHQAVTRYNETLNKSLRMPGSCAEFISLGQSEGIVEAIEP